MKTSIKTLTTICTVIISLSLSAQRNHNADSKNPKQQNNPQPDQNNNQNSRHNNNHVWSLNQHHGVGNWGGVTVQIGSYPNHYGYNYGYNNNFYNTKKAARNSIRQAAQVIGQALQYSDWNDTYSPWLAKAVRHQQYAKQLYFWGDYVGSLNHAERAGFLAWNTLSYFHNSFGYDDGFAGGNHPNPYSDPNNPYYKQNNSNNQANTSSDEDFIYRKGSPDKTIENSGTTKKEVHPNPEQKMNITELDGSLPQSKLNDKELLKTNMKDLDIE